MGGRSVLLLGVGFPGVLAGVSVFFESGARDEHESAEMRRWYTAAGYRTVNILPTNLQEFGRLTYREQIFSHTER